MSIELPEITLLAKGAPVAGGGPGTNEMLLALSFLALFVVGWSLISALFFGASVTIYNSFAGEDRRVVRVPMLKAVLVGFIHAGAMLVSQFVLQFLVGVLSFAMHSAAPGPGGPPLGLWGIWAALILGQLTGGWLVKALLATGFVPCRFGQGAMIGLIWLGCELALGLVLGGILLSLFYLQP